jgi:hypothetical protein
MSNTQQSTHQIKKLTLEEFYQIREEWTSLLNNSDANTLFLTWEWLNAWWIVWGNELGLELNIIACYSQNNRLMGLAPLYKVKGKFLRVFNSVRLGVIGVSYKIPTTIRSEFQDFIVDISDPIGIRKLLMKEILRDKSWDEFIINDVRSTSHLFALFTVNKVEEWSCYFRTILKDTGVSITTKGSFQDYLITIGKNTRNSAFNKSSLLKKTYDISEEEDDKFFTKNIKALNDLHLERWGKLCFDRNSEKFHSLIFKENKEIKSSFFRVIANKELVSVSYNVEYIGRCHNIQLGFSPSFDKKFALGNLNLGELIRRAFVKDSCEQFDMLLGAGQKTFYKERFKGELYLTSTFQIIRNPFIKMIYLIFDTYNRLVK